MFMAETLWLEHRHQFLGGHLSGVVRYHYSISPCLAEVVGFEPTDPSQGQQFSRLPLSASQPYLFISYTNYNTNFYKCQINWCIFSIFFGRPPRIWTLTKRFGVICATVTPETYCGSRGRIRTYGNAGVKFQCLTTWLLGYIMCISRKNIKIKGNIKTVIVIIILCFYTYTN